MFVCRFGVEVSTLFLFYKNIFYKNIETEICETLEYFKNKPESEIVKRI